MDTSELSRSLTGELSRSSTASTADPKRPKGQLGRAKRRQYSTDPTSEARNPERAQANLEVLIQGIVGRKSQYTYTPITRNQIRLLHILPARQRNETVKCRLKPVDLEDPGTVYEALSYTWGRDAPTEEIWIERTSKVSFKDAGRSVMQHNRASARPQPKDIIHSLPYYVRPNLDSALRYLRDYSDEQKEEVIWVDALCINQDDEVEKSQQVAKMADIYRRADNVFIWLGNESNDSGMAMDFVRHIIELEQEDTFSVKAADLQHWTAFTSLIRRDWFSRRWVVQELALAKNAFLTCGHDVVNWKDFAAAIEFFTDRFEEISTLWSDSLDFRRKLSTLGEIRAFPAGNIVKVTSSYIRGLDDEDGFERMKSLEKLVSELVMFEAGDPRDTVYALMSLAKDTSSHYEPWRSPSLGPMMRTHNPTIEADYKKNTLEVFKDFTAFCILRRRSLDIICRKWAPHQRIKPMSQAERLMHKGRKLPMEDLWLPSWIGLLKESAFGMPNSFTKSRVAGDTLVDHPRYDACHGQTAEDVLFGEVSIQGNGDSEDILLKDGPPITRQSEFKVSAEETLVSGRRRKSDGCIYVRGLEVETIERISHRLFEGLIPSEWLELGGWVEAPEHDASAPETIPEQLWRTVVADRTPSGDDTPGWYRHAMGWAISRRNANGDIHTAALIREGKPEKLVKFLQRAQSIIWNKRFFLLHKANLKHRFGLAPAEAQEGDIICILFGCNVPVVLRQIYDADGLARFQFIGEAYVYGMMEGEFLYGRTQIEVDQIAQEFCLV